MRVGMFGNLLLGCKVSSLSEGREVTVLPFLLYGSSVLNSSLHKFDRRMSLLEFGELGILIEYSDESEDLLCFSFRSSRCFMLSTGASSVLTRCCLACLWYPSSPDLRDEDVGDSCISRLCRSCLLLFAKFHSILQVFAKAPRNWSHEPWRIWCEWGEGVHEREQLRPTFHIAFEQDVYKTLRSHFRKYAVFKLLQSVFEPNIRILEFFKEGFPHSILCRLVH